MRRPCASGNAPEHRQAQTCTGSSVLTAEGWLAAKKWVESQQTACPTTALSVGVGDHHDAPADAPRAACESARGLAAEPAGEAEGQAGSQARELRARGNDDPRTMERIAEHVLEREERCAATDGSSRCSPTASAARAGAKRSPCDRPQARRAVRPLSEVSGSLSRYAGCTG